MAKSDDTAVHDAVREAVRSEFEAALLPLFASGLYEWRQTLPIVPQPVPSPLPAWPPLPIPGPVPQLFGLAQTDAAHALGEPDAATNPGPVPTLPLWFRREELRLDVDGAYPQMTASGTIQLGVLQRTHWVASLVPAGNDRWTGSIWYKDGAIAALPHTQVTIVAARSFFPNVRRARVTFTGGGAPARSVIYAFKSSTFRDVTFEFDYAQGTTPVTSVVTHGHPNHPAALLNETLSIETVFRRAGFAVTRSGDTPVPLALANANARWSDAEMHDAMQLHWSKFANKAQWAMWTFFASLHEMGTSLGGIMFDDIGPNHRQGTAIFNDSFIKNAPAGDAAPDAWVRRMRFWTAVHEMGHSFNLAHSWQKALGTAWIPLANEPEARSFMNYPYNVAGGQAAFFADFTYRFSDAELLFMRHAPERFVQMGNADWFDHHGFERGLAEQTPLQLEVRVNRERGDFTFLEPIVLELKLLNASTQVHHVDADILAGDHDTVVVLKREGRPARQWHPYARYCRDHNEVALQPGEALYASLFVSAGLNGWDIAEPGRYVVQVAIRHGEVDLVSNPLHLRMQAPLGHDEERPAQDLFSDDVGRALAFDGTRFLTGANDTLRDVVARAKGKPIAAHAKVALALPALSAFKEIDLDARTPAIKIGKPQASEAGELRSALIGNAEDAVATLGHIDYKFYVDRLSTFLADRGEPRVAEECQTALHKTLKARKVLPRVLAEIQARSAELRAGQMRRRKGDANESEAEG